MGQKGLEALKIPAGRNFRSGSFPEKIGFAVRGLWSLGSARERPVRKRALERGRCVDIAWKNALGPESCAGSILQGETFKVRLAAWDVIWQREDHGTRKIPKRLALRREGFRAGKPEKVRLRKGLENKKLH